MIKFFRKIRYNLMQTGKTSKYFKYATGEIVLVVIGILIALQINNWNENRKIKNETYNLSKRLLDEINKNIKSLEKSAVELKNIDTATLKTLDLMGEDYSKVDASKLDSLLFTIIITPRNEFYSAILNEALATGKVSLFENDSIKQIIYDIPTYIQEVKSAEKGMDLDINENLVRFFYDNISLRAVDSKFSDYASKITPSKLKPLDNRIILSSRKFENIVDNKYYLMQLLKAKHKNTKTQFLRLKNLLKKEIETNN
ncbi:MAG: hypothetical protein ACJA1B_001487 [Polaribacter sp.]|jgi:hypothetical protein